MANVNVILPPEGGQFSHSKEKAHLSSYSREKPASKQRSTGNPPPRVPPSTTVGSIQKRKTSEAHAQIIDPAIYRNSLFHNICTAILAEGYHKSFTELFTLVQQQREEHRLAGPGAILLTPLIDDSEEKLKYLQAGLIKAEEAGRHANLEVVYATQRDMALHFDKLGDSWLSDHFHNQCLVTGSSVKGDNRRKEGEAHFHVGLAYERRGDLQTGAHHVEIFHQLASSHSWHAETGESWYRISCEHLRRIYTSIAEKSDDMNTSIDYLHKAHDIAKKSRDTYQEGLASHRLGCAYEKIDKYDTAIQHHKSFLERVRYHGDEVGVGNAYEALARCHESKGDISNAVKCLELFVEVAERTGANESLAKASSAAGIMFNTLGEYGKAVEYFSKLYSICHTLDDKELMESAQVHYGIAQTHYKMTMFTDTISNTSDKGIANIVHWKGKHNFPEN